MQFFGMRKQTPIRPGNTSSYVVVFVACMLMSQCAAVGSFFDSLGSAAHQQPTSEQQQSSSLFDFNRGSRSPKSESEAESNYDALVLQHQEQQNPHSRRRQDPPSEFFTTKQSRDVSGELINDKTSSSTNFYVDNAGGGDDDGFECRIDDSKDKKFTVGPYTGGRINIIPPSCLLLARKHLILNTIGAPRYDALVSPAGLGREANVMLTSKVISVEGVRDNEKRVSMVVFLSMRWYDQRLIWSPARYGNVTAVELAEHSGETRKIWTPHIDMLEWSMIHRSDMLRYTTLVINSDGSVDLRGFIVDEINCMKWSAHKYPFDRQVCDLTIRSRDSAFFSGPGGRSAKDNGASDGSSLSSRTAEAEEELDSVDEPSASGDWVEERLMVQDKKLKRGSMRRYRLTLVRVPEKHILIWILPANLLAFVSLIGAYAGCDVTERFSFGSTIMVSLVLLLIGVKSEIPVKSQKFPILGTYYVVLFVMVCVAITVSRLPQPLAKFWLYARSRREKSKVLCEHTQPRSKANIRNDGGETKKLSSAVQGQNNAIFHGVNNPLSEVSVVQPATTIHNHFASTSPTIAEYEQAACNNEVSNVRRPSQQQKRNSLSASIVSSNTRSTSRLNMDIPHSASPVLIEEHDFKSNENQNHSACRHSARSANDAGLERIQLWIRFAFLLFFLCVYAGLNYWAFKEWTKPDIVSAGAGLFADSKTAKQT